MRITKIIKDRIEKAVQSKYLEAYNKIGENYQTLHKAYREEIEELRKQTEEKALAITAKYGFTYPSGTYNGSLSRIVTISDNAHDFKEKDKIHKEQDSLWKKKEEMLEQIYFDLEVGETDKSELKNVLESISF